MKSKATKRRFFIDTNILIYCFDRRYPAKQKKSNELIAEALSSGLGVISHQVIQEFVSVALTKFQKSFNPEQLIAYLDEVLFGLWKSYPSREMYLEAILLQRSYKLSWWDSLVVAAAIETGCSIIFSEDMQHEGRIATVDIINPY